MYTVIVIMALVIIVLSVSLKYAIQEMRYYRETAEHVTEQHIQLINDLYRSEKA